jgi:hypothetical protein
VVSALQWVSAGSASLAAVFWLLSSIVKLPPDQITWQTIDKIVPALRKQGRLNAVGAIFAAISAAIQAFLIVAPTCINM